MSRLTEIIAGCTDDAGRVDRAQLFKALSVHPDDPAAILLEAAAVSQENVAEMRKLMEKAVSDMRATVDAQRATGAKIDEFTRAISSAADAAVKQTDTSFAPLREAALREISTTADATKSTLKDIADQVSAARRVRIGAIWLVCIVSGILAGAGMFFLLRYIAARVAGA